MASSDAGSGRAGLIVRLAIIGFVLYVGIKVIPVYVLNYELADHLRQSALQAVANRLPDEAIQTEVVGYAQHLGLPVNRENVQVAVSSQAVSIRVDYTVPVDLKVYTWVLHFKPSAESLFL